LTLGDDQLTAVYDKMREIGADLKFDEQA
jgi:hypothetical protein